MHLMGPTSVPLISEHNLGQATTRSSTFLKFWYPDPFGCTSFTIVVVHSFNERNDVSDTLSNVHLDNVNVVAIC